MKTTSSSSAPRVIFLTSGGVAVLLATAVWLLSEPESASPPPAVIPTLRQADDDARAVSLLTEREQIGKVPAALQPPGPSVAATDEIRPTNSPGSDDMLVRFSGRVQDASGAPVAGALVAVLPNAQTRSDRELPQLFSRPVRESGLQTLSHTTTDTAGRFELSESVSSVQQFFGLGGGPSPRLLIQADGWALCLFRLIPQSLPNAILGNFVLEIPESRLTLTVRNGERISVSKPLLFRIGLSHHRPVAGALSLADV